MYGDIRRLVAFANPIGDADLVQRIVAARKYALQERQKEGLQIDDAGMQPVNLVGQALAVPADGVVDRVRRRLRLEPKPIVSRRENPESPAREAEKRH